MVFRLKNATKGNHFPIRHYVNACAELCNFWSHQFDTRLLSVNIRIMLIRKGHGWQKNRRVWIVSISNNQIFFDDWFSHFFPLSTNRAYTQLLIHRFSLVNAISFWKCNTISYSRLFWTFHCLKTCIVYILELFIDREND